MLTTTMDTFFDLTKEWKRWDRFFNIMNGDDPEVGQTPRQVVWKKNKSTLWYYPAKEKQYDVPVFIVYSLINKPFILDLAPGSSIIECLVEKGYDVYLLDWGYPGYEDRDISLGDYIVDYLQKAVKRALRHSKAEEISLLGYCLGGTMAAIYTAIADEPIKNLITATVPIDFSVNAAPDKWLSALKKGEFNLDRLIDIYGVVPPQYINAMFRAVSSPVYFSPYTTLFAKVYDDRFVEKWKRMNKWTNEHVPFAGEAFRQIVNDLMKENKLIKGKLTIQDKMVNLATIKANFLVISSKRDHIVPERQSLPVMDLIGSADKTYEKLEAGHVSLAISKQFQTSLTEWLSERSQNEKCLV